MVNCLQTATTTPCPGGGALPGVFLYPTEMNVADGEQMKLQIITNSYKCDDAGYIATEYCIDWGDGSHTSGTFSGSYAVPGNVEVPHVYRFPAGWEYDSKSYRPSVTISNVCGGVRTVNTQDVGASNRVYVWKPGTLAIPPPNMSGYKLAPTFNENSCAGIFPDCTNGETDSACQDGFTRKCVEGFWARDLNHSCTGGSDDNVGYVSPGGGNTGGYPNVGGGTPSGGGTDIFGGIMDFYENNKMISIAGIALLGGVILFGGGD